MQLKIKNCNNIENGEFDITEGRLNIKYAINGTGKSTISKAIEAFVTNDQEKKNLLLPFKYYGVEEENSPELIGYDQFKKVSVFNEKYIEDYVYQQNELIALFDLPAHWLMSQMNAYCVGANYVFLDGKHYYTVHHA